MEKLIHFSGLKQIFDISIILPIENFITFCFIVLLLSILTVRAFLCKRKNNKNSEEKRFLENKQKL